MNHTAANPNRRDAMKYVAYIETNGTSVRVLPRGKKTSFFKTLKPAQDKLSKMNLSENGRGIVYAVNNNDERELVWSIAL
jgi:hypothetical protein